jgi:hypothetical protein
MRTLILLLLFPLSLFSQELPDSILAKHKNVKKLIILVCYDSIPCDTQDVFVLDGTWKNANGNPPIEDQMRDTSRHKIVYDERGRMIFSGPKKGKPKHCWVDSAYCHTYKYNDKNQLVAAQGYSCEKGVTKTYYQYDNTGKLILITWEPRGDILVTREEYSYNKEGKLDSVISWWAVDPENPVRDSRDTKSSSIVYQYENGLITGAIADDPYGYWVDTKPIYERSSKVILRYTYIY